ncbi:MAG: BatD family protein [Aureliella sp.]
MWRLCVVLLWMLVSLLMSSSRNLHSKEPVQASVGRDSAWVGEPVPLIVTLYSAGPFVGVASFDLPELPQTAILRIGNAVVGSEQVEGESMLTQRHEFSVFTQRTGEIEIPPFVVRFKGKESFVGEPIAVEGTTDRLHFASRRLPGTGPREVVVSTPELIVEQSWNPSESVAVRAGDVIERRVTRRVTQTSSMMLPPIKTGAIEGVRVYETDPIVEDNVDRGELSASRADTIKYQFEQPGDFQLPELEFTWWDPKKEEIQRSVLAGLNVRVSALGPHDDASQGQAKAGDKEAAGKFRWRIWIGVLTILTAVAVMSTVVVQRWKVRSAEPARVVARQVRAACKANDAREAYVACMAWLRLCESDRFALEAKLGEAWKQLRVFLYSGESFSEAWRGDALGVAFATAERALRRKAAKRSDKSLPPLNP